MELICSPGRERGEAFGVVEGRVDPPLWEGDGRGILSQLIGGRAKERRCQAGLGSEGGLRSF